GGGGTASGGEVVDGLEEERSAGNAGSLFPQARNHLVGIHFSYFDGLELRKHARGAGAVAAASEGSHGINGGIGKHDVGERAHLFGHFRKGRVLVRLGVNPEAGGCLLREKYLVCWVRAE